MYKEKLSEKYKDKFTSAIIFRGREYNLSGNVQFVKKDENTERYISKVESKDFDKEYDVQIEILDDDIKMSCTCPCVENCKHEYATLLSIDNEEYSTIKFIDVPNEKEDIEKLIFLIPEKELKEYLNSVFIQNRNIDKYDIILKFSKYFPEKSKEYIFATTYNDLVSNKTDFFYKYIRHAKESLEMGKYEYTFNIISSVTDAVVESKYDYNEEYIFEKYSILATFLRVAYKKGNTKLKEKIKKWIKKYENNKYYNDIYIEDMLSNIPLN